MTRETFRGEAVRVLDTTLCDGARADAVAFDLDDRIEIAAALEALGVDVIEAGSPCTSPAERRAVRAVARTLRSARVCALVRGRPDAIDAAWEAVAPARAARLHVFLTNADGADPAQVERSVAHARRYTDDVEFTPVDALRLERAARADLVRAALAGGATTIDVADTAGCARPDEVASVLAALRADVPELAAAVLAFRGRDDLGMATANALAAVAAGARQVEVTVNGLGERAGNASLEEVAVALAVHGDALGVHTRVLARLIGRTSRLVERCSGVAVPAHKAIVGRSVFRSAAGTAGAASPFGNAPGSVHPVEIQRGLGGLSGPQGFAARVRALGIELASDELERAFERFERLIEREHRVGDAELRRICAPPEAWPGPGI